MTDPIVDSVCAKLQARSAVGIKKYGTTLAGNSATVKEKLVHIQEELMDAANYVEWLLQEEEMATAKEIVNAAMKPLGIDIEWEERKEMPTPMTIEMEAALDALARWNPTYEECDSDIISETACVQFGFLMAGHHGALRSALQSCLSKTGENHTETDLITDDARQAAFDEGPDGMLAYHLAMSSPNKDDPNWPLPSFKATDWAEAFCKCFTGVPIDEATAWFANALMRGYDEHARAALSASRVMDGEK